MSNKGSIEVKTSYSCSECGHTEDTRGAFFDNKEYQNVCPNCGARLL